MSAVVTHSRWLVSLPDETMVLDTNGAEVAQVLGDYEADYERMAARAKLISAAPELLAALKAAVEWGAPMAEAPTANRPRWFDLARAAILKTTGAA